MGLMDSIDVQYIWKAIQESERSDEYLYLNTTLSDWLSQACHSAQAQAEIQREPERGGGEEHMPTAGTVPEGGYALLPSRQNQMLPRRLEGRLSDG